MEGGLDGGGDEGGAGCRSMAPALASLWLAGAVLSLALNGSHRLFVATRSSRTSAGPTPIVVGSCASAEVRARLPPAGAPRLTPLACCCPHSTSLSPCAGGGSAGDAGHALVPSVQISWGGGLRGREGRTNRPTDRPKERYPISGVDATACFDSTSFSFPQRPSAAARGRPPRRFRRRINRSPGRSPVLPPWGASQQRERWTATRVTGRR